MTDLLNVSDQPQQQKISPTGLKTSSIQQVVHKTTRKSVSAARTRTASTATWIPARMARCASSMARTGRLGRPLVAKQTVRDQSNASSRTSSSLGLENLFSTPKKPVKESKTVTPEWSKISPASTTSQKLSVKTRASPGMAEPEAAKQSVREESSTSSSDDSLGLESLFSTPKKLVEEGKPVTPVKCKINPAMTAPHKYPMVQVKLATTRVLLPLPPCLNIGATTRSKDVKTGATPWKEKLDEASASSAEFSSSEGGLAEERLPEDSVHSGARAPPSGYVAQTATDLFFTRTTWVLFPNGKYQIIVDYPNGIRKVFLSYPGAVYKPGPHQLFLPSGGDLSRPGLIVPQDMVHLLLPSGIATPQQQRSPVAVPVMCDTSGAKNL